MPASITSPVGKVIGSLTSKGGVSVSLQWIRVSSKSKITDFRSILKAYYFKILGGEGDGLAFASYPRLRQTGTFPVS
jgi:hypothetical protein